MTDTEAPELLQPRVLVEDVPRPVCLRWHAERLWFLDGRALCTADLQGRTAVALTATAGTAFCFGANAQLFFVDMQRGDLFRQEADGPRRLVRVYPFGGLIDFVAHPRGQLYFIGRGFDSLLREPRTGNLFLVSPDGVVKTVIEESLALPTGIDVSPDGGTLLLAEDLEPRLTAYPLAPDGTPSRGRKLNMQWSKETHVRRLCADAAGGVWVVTWWNRSPGAPRTVPAYECIRVTESAGVTHRIPMPGKWIDACVLGGPDHQTLFLGTTLEVEDGKQQPTDRGFIEAVSLDIPEAGWP
ncbi:MAG TPA: SMP-30/gluconolactonase/LRE family protein [Dehalococcoidia bacterium]|nr:SMP-30/gluconolactonase/LRE family protein [Dehalococcoidia bacterium]